MIKIPTNNVALCREETKPEKPLTRSEGLSVADENHSHELEQITGSESQWVTSKEAKRKLKIPSCELMHRRERGELRFKKRGNSFLYKIEINDIT
jgi:hypothetical protein